MLSHSRTFYPRWELFSSPFPQTLLEKHTHWIPGLSQKLQCNSNINSIYSHKWKNIFQLVGFFFSVSQLLLRISLLQLYSDLHYMKNLVFAPVQAYKSPWNPQLMAIKSINKEYNLLNTVCILCMQAFPLFILCHQTFHQNALVSIYQPCDELMTCPWSLVFALTTGIGSHNPTRISSDR